MTVLARSANDLASLQCRDGGWPYQPGGSSWTEPTCLALLALCASVKGLVCAPAERAVQWLIRHQRADGGWPPNPGVALSTWVTAMAVLSLQSREAKPSLDRALPWLLASTGEESGWSHRLRALLLGQSSGSSTDGWPWYPGASAWVEPTAQTVLSLRRFPAARDRVRSGTNFVLARQCRDGGWNHGSTRALGYEGDSYPESTGWALLALRGVKDGRVKAGVAAAQNFLARTPSGESRSLLELGLLAQGEGVAAEAPPPAPGRVRALSLWILAAAAREGTHVL